MLLIHVFRLLYSSNRYRDVVLSTNCSPSRTSLPLLFTDLCLKRSASRDIRLSKTSRYTVKYLILFIYTFLETYFGSYWSFRKRNGHWTCQYRLQLRYAWGFWFLSPQSLFFNILIIILSFFRLLVLEDLEPKVLPSHSFLTKKMLPLWILFKTDLTSVSPNCQTVSMSLPTVRFVWVYVSILLSFQSKEEVRKVSWKRKPSYLFLLFLCPIWSHC